LSVEDTYDDTIIDTIFKGVVGLPLG